VKHTTIGCVRLKVKAGDLFEKTPDIHKMEILADKLPK